MITTDSLVPLDMYRQIRPTYRQRASVYRDNRRVQLGDHVSFSFENDVTIKYQIQEIMHAENITAESDIQAEVDSYAPLVSHGHDLIATMMIEYPDKEERKIALQELRGIEDKIYIKVDEKKYYAIANEDLERTNSVKTSAVHFLRFTFDKEAINKLHHEAEVTIGSDHERYIKSRLIAPDMVHRLASDLH